MKQLKLSLRDNSRSFLEDALANAITAERVPGRWKFAVLSMVQAIELTLKQLLYEVHPLFVFENVDKTTKTVGLDHAVKRLGAVSKLRLSDDETEALKTAKEARDQITHYEVDANVEHLKLSFSRLLGFLADFYDEHFEVPLYEQVDVNLWSKGVAIQAYGKELHQRAMKRASGDVDATHDTLIVCPACGWRPMVVREDGDGTCYVCGHKTEIVFCERCEVAIPADEVEEEGGHKYCQSCLEYVSSDHWYEQRAGK